MSTEEKGDVLVLLKDDLLITGLICGFFNRLFVCGWFFRLMSTMADDLELRRDSACRTTFALARGIRTSVAYLTLNAENIM